MRAFAHLTTRGQVRRLRGLALVALGQYELVHPQLTLLSNHEHTLFRVDVSPTAPAHPERFVLRMYHPAAFDADSVALELEWLTALAQDTPVQVPQPVATPAGAFLIHASHPGVPEARICVLFRWVSGRLLRKKLYPGVLQHLGQCIGHLHNYSEHFRPSRGRTGQCWDWERVFGGQSIVGPASNWPLLSRDQQMLFRATAERVSATMQRLGDNPSVFGLIHADIHTANYLVERGRIGLIDFEDCGWGYYLYDLAVVLDQIEAEYVEQAQVLRAALLQGYRQIRPLSAEHEALLDIFIAMRLAELVRWFGSSNKPEFEPSTASLLRQVTDYMYRLLNSTVAG
jgi:Ser/Thr protein kinase RdoA (MazF antagonist)